MNVIIYRKDGNDIDTPLASLETDSLSGPT